LGILGVKCRMSHQSLTMEWLKRRRRQRLQGQRSRLQTNLLQHLRRLGEKQRCRQAGRGSLQKMGKGSMQVVVFAASTSPAALYPSHTPPPFPPLASLLCHTTHVIQMQGCILHQPLEARIFFSEGKLHLARALSLRSCSALWCTGAYI
jgi:hypothetical protein